MVTQNGLVFNEKINASIFATNVLKQMSIKKRNGFNYMFNKHNQIICCMPDNVYTSTV